MVEKALKEKAMYNTQLLCLFAKEFRRRYDELVAAGKLDHASGQYVVINVLTGEYVLGNMPGDAMQKAEKEFGSRDYCWSRKVGTP